MTALEGIAPYGSLRDPKLMEAERVADADDAAERAAVLATHRGEGLTLFRVVSDLHSGRILGEYGFLLMDGAALVLLLLTGSGLHNWLITRKSRNGMVVGSTMAEGDVAASAIHVRTVEPSEPS